MNRNNSESPEMEGLLQMENAEHVRAEDPSRHFLNLIRKHGDRIFNFAYRLTGNEPDARDLVGDALARALDNWERYDNSRPFDTWVLKIIHNRFLDNVRRYAAKHTVSLDAPSPAEESSWEDMLPGTDRDPLEGLLAKERELAIQDGLNALPADYRTAVILCDIEQFSYQDISQIMECPVGTVRSRIHQGRLLLRKQIENRMSSHSIKE